MYYDIIYNAVFYGRTALDHPVPKQSQCTQDFWCTFWLVHELEWPTVVWIAQNTFQNLKLSLALSFFNMFKSVGLTLNSIMQLEAVVGCSTHYLQFCQLCCYSQSLPLPHHEYPGASALNSLLYYRGRTVKTAAICMNSIHWCGSMARLRSSGILSWMPPCRHW